MIVGLLRFGGVVTFSAFATLLLPVDWMAATHRWLGLGEFPRMPIVDYLARSVAALYGFHGVLLFIISSDIRRYRPLIWYVAAMNVLFGLMLIAIGRHAGLPSYWLAVEGPSVLVIGVLVAVLISRVEPAGKEPGGVVERVP